MGEQNNSCPTCKHDMTIGELSSSIKHITNQQSKLDGEQSTLDNKLDHVLHEITSNQLTQQQEGSEIRSNLTEINTLMKMHSEQLKTITNVYTNLHGELREILTKLNTVDQLSKDVKTLELRIDKTEAKWSKNIAEVDQKIDKLNRMRYFFYAAGVILAAILTILEVVAAIWSAVRK